ncbi:GMC oxidoreductase domain-containing protein [Phthorimaea operculella]|nr:GMC oxidoreductase domain-containing protein [Phthorimaea operculella]
MQFPNFLSTEDNKQLDLLDQGYHAQGGPLTVSQFPYHPPLSYSIVKAGEELDQEYHAQGGPLTVSQFPYHPPLSYSIVKAGEELGKWTNDEEFPFSLVTEDNMQMDLVDQGYHSQGGPLTVSQTYYNKQLDLVDQSYHAQGGPLTVSQFPYHPPLSYSIVKAGEELDQGYHAQGGPLTVSQLPCHPTLSYSIVKAGEELGKWTKDEESPYFLRTLDNKQLDLVDQEYRAQGGPLTVSQFPYHPPLSYSIVKAGEELGYQSRDLNGEQHTGFSIAQTTNRNGSRLSVARAFLRPAKNRSNLHVMLNATVTKILINQTTRQAYAVEVRNSFGGTETIFANNEIVLSAGAVASPQILQLSGIGDPEVLSRAGVKLVHRLPSVGKNLHNHVAHFLNFNINDNNTTPLNWATAMEYLLFRDGLMSGTGISEVTAFINTKYANPQEDNPDIQLFFGGFLADCAKTGMVGERLDNNSRSIQIIPTVLHPKSRGRLEIRSADPFEYPKIHANYLTHPDDVKTLIEGIKFAIRLSETKALKRFGVKLDKTPVKGCEKIKFGCDAYWECAVRMQTAPENHQAGSCKMGPRGDPTAVVDNLLQVQGIDRLRVADASVMPAVTSGNTNAPTVMIGERVSDFIKQRWLGATNPPFPVGGHGGVSNVLQLQAAESRAQPQPQLNWQPWG